MTQGRKTFAEHSTQDRSSLTDLTYRGSLGFPAMHRVRLPSNICQKRVSRRRANCDVLHKGWSLNPLVPALCPCRRRLDAYGDHSASCPRSGLLRSRAVPLERAAARVCREAGATVATNVLLRDLNLVVQRQDERRIEVIANGLPLWSGAQLAVDTTLVSALDSAGQARRHQRLTAGAALRVARKAKERTYPELLRSARCRLVVVGIELGGRWSEEAAQFIRLLARSRSRAAPPLLRSSAWAAYVARWSALLSFAAVQALAASLLSLPLAIAANVDGEALELSDLLGAAASEAAPPPPVPSRLPLRT